jgi:hypothetical protein
MRNKEVFKNKSVKTVGELIEWLNRAAKLSVLGMDTPLQEFHAKIPTCWDGEDAVIEEEVTEGIVCGLTMMDNYAFEFISQSLGNRVNEVFLED